MEIVKTVVAHPFFWGFCLGFLFFVLSVVAHWKTKREHTRLQRHLSDKLELEANQYATVKAEKETLAKENENLRLKIGQLNEKPNHKIQRDVEIMVRAEKRMMISAPGFAAAWETAKAEAASEVQDEDAGKSAPKKLFSKLFGMGTDAEGAKNAEPQQLLEDSGDAKPATEEPAAESKQAS